MAKNKNGGGNNRTTSSARAASSASGNRNSSSGGSRGGQRAAQEAATSTNNSGRAATRTRISAIKDAGSVGKALKIAASNDGSLGGREVKAIQNTYDAGSLKIQGKVDTLNEKFGKQNGYIGYKAGVWNNLNSGKYDTTADKRSRLYGGIMDRTFGSGSANKFGFGTPNNRNFQKIDKGLTAYSPKGVSTQYRPTALNKTMQNGWNMFTPKTVPVLSGGGTDTGTGAGEVLPNDYTPPTDTVAAETTDPIGMMSGGGAGINSAMGIRRKKSSAKLSGAANRGTNQFNRGLSINSFNV